jgi:hypothetical protein
MAHPDTTVIPSTLSSSKSVTEVEYRCVSGSSTALRPVETVLSQNTASCPLPQPRNGACLHVACCAQSFCFISELKRVLKSYMGGSKDQFKKKAVNQAIR